MTKPKKIYRRKKHSVSLLHAHLVFCVKYRRHVITARAFDALRLSMRRTAQLIGIELTAVQSDGDHLHLMICYPPTLSISKIVHRLKGASSRHLRAKKLPEVLRSLWGKAFWSPSYFVVSCGGAPLDVVKHYVENQENPLRVHRSPTATTKRKPISPYPRTEVRGLRVKI